MFNISKLVKKITDPGSGREGETSGSMFVSPNSEDQHSAEGFLCPPCMRAFPSPEALEAHYNATHINNEATSTAGYSPNDSSNGDDMKVLRQEIQSLQHSLEEEKITSEELKKEVHKMQVGFQGGADSESALMQAQEKEFESAKNLLNSEVALLRKQLTDSLEQVSQEKREKEKLQQKYEALSSEADGLRGSISNLDAQLAHKNSIDDAAVLKQELVSVQRMMDQLALEKEKEIEKLNEKLLGLETSEKVGAAELQLSEANKEMELLKRQLQNSNNELDRLRVNHEAASATISEKYKNVEEKLSHSNHKNTELEEERSALKEEVKRLNDQYTELYKQVEAGAGVNTALEAVQRENELLKGNISSLNEKATEHKTNLHQMGKQLEAQVGTLSEQKKQLETAAIENHQLKEKMQSLNDSIKEKSARLKVAAEQHRELESTKDKKISLMMSEFEKSTSELKVTIEGLQKIKQSQEKRLSELETEIKSLSMSATEKENAMKQLKSSEENLLKQLEEKSSELNKMSTSLQDIQRINLELEQNLTNAETQSVDMQKDFSAKVASLEAQLKEESRTFQNTIKDLESAKALSDKAAKKAQQSAEEIMQQERGKTEQLAELEKTTQDIRSKHEESESRLQVLQVQTDVVLGEKIELEKRLKSNEEEKALLLDKCLSGEAEMEELRQSIKSMQRKLEDSNAALQELGRENQSLQMESAKLQGRKWADDSVVTNCSTCDKEFTLTIRKHHCRHCGQIYCNDCSSRTAAVPSCKKPARVCDPCYQELLSK